MSNKGYFVHESSYIDDNVSIGEETKIWHFCHVQSGAQIGQKCSFGQNVNVSNNVIIGNGVKVQNNVSIYEEKFKKLSQRDKESILHFIEYFLSNHN